MNTLAAKELVVRAGRELVKSGLVARTWGNASCRVDEKCFAITPSGRSYENMKPEEIVLCKIEDCSYEGDSKPSSEKGIHALLYKTHPDVSFVIHTHQPAASAVSAAGIREMPVSGFSLLGDTVPIATYGLPGTKKLRKGIAKALTACTGHAVIMSHHGAVCFGNSYEETFSAAKQLEEACLAYVHQLYLKASGARVYDEHDFYKYYVTSLLGKNAPVVEHPAILSNSRRAADGFILESDKETYYRFDSKDLVNNLLIHKAIYESRTDINFISQSTGSGSFAVSLAKSSLLPLLDDFVQIVGLSARCAESAAPEHIAAALKGRTGVLVPCCGALCCTGTRDDAAAVNLVMEKDALAQISTQLLGGGKRLGLFDSLLMHVVYTKSYSKKAKGKG